MTYATQQNLIDRFGTEEITELSDRDGDSVIDTAVMDQALAAADGVIDAHLGARYLLPLNPVPALIVDIACDLARHRLYDDTPPDVVEKRYKEAQAALSKLSSGELVIDAAKASGGEAGGSVRTSVSDRVFNRDSMETL